MNNFPQAVNTLLDFEGRTISNIGDGAGITAYGITLPYLKQMNGAATEDDLRSMTEDYAKVCYEVVTWNKLLLPHILDLNCATRILLDATNMGHGAAGLILQRAINNCGGTVTVDGAIGPKTIMAANSLDPEILVYHQSHQAHLYHNSIPGHERWPGWLRRDAWPQTPEQMEW